MSTYKVLPGANSDFKIEVTSAGIKQTMLGFNTEAAALEWVDAHQAHGRTYRPTLFETGKKYGPADVGDD